MRTRTAFAVCIGLIVMGILATPDVGQADRYAIKASSPVTLGIKPPTLTVGMGSQFEVKVVIEDVVDLGSFEFEVQYTPSVIHIEDIQLGSFPSSSGRNWFPLGPEIDNEEGKASFGGFSWGDEPGPSGMGVLATITMTAQGLGSSALALQNSQVTDTSAQPQTVIEEAGEVLVSCNVYLPLILKSY